MHAWRHRCCHRTQKSSQKAHCNGPPRPPTTPPMIFFAFSGVGSRPFVVFGKSKLESAICSVAFDGTASFPRIRVRLFAVVDGSLSIFIPVLAAFAFFAFAVSQQSVKSSSRPLTFMVWFTNPDT